jgi:hypothetical protein
VERSTPPGRRPLSRRRARAATVPHTVHDHTVCGLGVERGQEPTFRRPWGVDSPPDRKKLDAGAEKCVKSSSMRCYFLKAGHIEAVEELLASRTMRPSEKRASCFQSAATFLMVSRRGIGRGSLSGTRPSGRRGPRLGFARYIVHLSRSAVRVVRLGHAAAAFRNRRKRDGDQQQPDQSGARRPAMTKTLSQPLGASGSLKAELRHSSSAAVAAPAGERQFQSWARPDEAAARRNIDVSDECTS